MRFSIFIPGDPVAQPRYKVATKDRRGKPLPFPRHYIPKGHPVHKWRKIVRSALEEVGPDIPMKGNVVLRLEFNFMRPDKHLGTGRNAGTLKTSAPDAHIQKPDLDNLEKPIMDELEDASWYVNDCQVDEKHSYKYWCMPTETPGVEIVFEHD